MKNTLVIPTDFSIQSLNVLKTVLHQNNSGQKLDLILLHGFQTGDSIRDLLFFSKSQQLSALMSKEFEEALEVIRNKFNSQISSLKIDLFHGYRVSGLDAYLEVNTVKEIYVSTRKPEFAHKNSFDLLPMIAKCGTTAIVIESISTTATPDKGKIADVFINQVSIG